MTAERQELWDVEKVMEFLDVSRDYVRWIRENHLLLMWKVGNKWRTTPPDIDDFINLTRGNDLSGEADIITFAKRHKLI